MYVLSCRSGKMNFVNRWGNWGRCQSCHTKQLASLIPRLLFWGESLGMRLAVSQLRNSLLSLVPRSHLLKKRAVNQVEFIGLAYTFRTSVTILVCAMCAERVFRSQVEIWSCNLIGSCVLSTFWKWALWLCSPDSRDMHDLGMRSYHLHSLEIQD